MNESHIAFLSSPEWARMLETDLLPWVEAAGHLGDDVLEIGPGPGLTTDLLRARTVQLTAVEVDASLAGSLRQRMEGTNAEVICRDATATGFTSSRFSAVTCFSVLHHMDSAADQDRLFAEIARVLRPAGYFLGADSLDLEGPRQAHQDGTFTPVDPGTLPERLASAGLALTRIDRGAYQFRFAARKQA